MIEIKQKNRVRDWTESLLASGRYSFALEEIVAAFPNMSTGSLRLALQRLRVKGKISPVFRGYYLIIPPQYSQMGILPPSMFMDQLMAHLGRWYYMGLLSAAGYHGASHQSPQETFVMTGFPVMRDTLDKGLRIKYTSKEEPSEKHLIKVKTEAGYLQVSSVPLTLFDIVRYHQKCGGLNRVATVIAELAESLQPGDFDDSLLLATKVSVIQRLGALFEALGLNNNADELYYRFSDLGLHMRSIPLNSAKPSSDSPVNKRWNVIMNTKIEPDI